MFTISESEEKDAEAISEIIELSWYATYVTPEIGVTKKDIGILYAEHGKEQIEALRRRVREPQADDISFVAKEGERVVGYIRFKVLKDDIELRSLYVHPDYTGKGIGTQLWKKGLAAVPSEKTIFIETADHTRAIAFYTKMGFVDTGERYLAPDAMADSGIRLPLVKMVYTRPSPIL